MEQLWMSSWASPCLKHSLKIFWPKYLHISYIRVRIDKPDLSITDYFTWDDSVRSFYSTTYMIYVITVRSFSRSPGTKYKHKTLQFSQKCGLTKLRENRWKFSQLWWFKINWCIIRLWENFTNIQQNWFIKIVTLKVY